MHKGRRLKPVRQPRGAEYVPLIPDSSPANRARGRNATPTPPCASLSLESYHSPPPRLPGGVLRFSCALLTAHVAAIPRVCGHAPHVNIVSMCFASRLAAALRFRHGALPSRANRARGPNPTTPAWAGTRTARQARRHDTRVPTTRALRGATPADARQWRCHIIVAHGRRRPSMACQTMAMRMHAIVAKQVCKPRKARCHTWNARCANLGKHVVTPGKPGVQTSERMLPNLESQVCKPPKPFGQTHAAVLTNPRCHTTFLGKQPPNLK